APSLTAYCSQFQYSGGSPEGAPSMSDTLGTSETIPSPNRAVLDLYAETMSDVRFPDISAEILDAQVEAIRAHTATVEAARDALAASAARLDAERAVLAELAKKAIAYARIYAADRPELSAQLDAIDLGASDAPARKRGRPRKRGAEQ